MSEQRREPTISTMPLDSREESTRARPQAPVNSPERKGPPRPPPVSSRPVVVRSPLAPLAFVVALLVGLFAGYTYWLLLQAQQQLKQSDTQLQSSDLRIAGLEKRLSLSDDESTQSLTVIQAKVKENESEIRKLWGVSYDRNRKAISDLEESVTKLTKSVGGIDSRLKKSLEDAMGEIRVISELLEAQQSAISKTEQLFRSQQANVAQLQEKFQAVETDLRKKVGNNEESIKAIDSFRQQVNRDLLKLKGG